MYADTSMLRSFSSLAVDGSGSALGDFNDGYYSKRSLHREPLKLKLSILSGMNPATRSILNAPIRPNEESNFDRWRTDNGQERNGSLVNVGSPPHQKNAGVTMAIIGTRRTTDPDHSASHFDPSVNATRLDPAINSAHPDPTTSTFRSDPWRSNSHFDPLSSTPYSDPATRISRVDPLTTSASKTDPMTTGTSYPDPMTKGGSVKYEPSSFLSSPPRVHSKGSTSSMNNSLPYTSLDGPTPFPNEMDGERDGLRSREHFTHDRDRVIGPGSPSAKNQRRGGRYTDNNDDTDEELDEVFASIVRRGELTDDVLIPIQTQPHTAGSKTKTVVDCGRTLHCPTVYKSTSDQAGTNHYSRSRHRFDHITRPLLAKLEYNNSPSLYTTTAARSGPYFTSNGGVNHEKPLCERLEKATSDGSSTGKFAANTVQLDDDDSTGEVGWYTTNQPYYSYYPSTTSRGEIEIRAIADVTGQRRAGNGERRCDIITDTNSGKLIRKSDPFLNIKREAGSLRDDSSLLDKKEISSLLEKQQTPAATCTFLDEETCAGSGTSYYVKDFTVSKNGRRTYDDPAGKLRTAKSEGSLRMAKPDLLLSDDQSEQIRIMNHGLSVSRIYVCQCLANLYIDDGTTCSTSTDAGWADSWRHVATGVPVLLLEWPNTTRTYKESTSTAPRRLLIRLAEHGNGFKLWEDVIDSSSDYTVDRTFHTLVMSGDYKRRAGLSFDSHSAALQFHQHVRKFSEELDTCGANNGERVKRKNKSIWTPFRRANITDRSVSSIDTRQYTAYPRHSEWPSFLLDQPTGPLKKTEISSPCCFKHVTSLKPGDLLPSAALLVNDDSPSTISTSTGTLTRINRAATIKAAAAKANQCSTPEENAGVIAFPKRAHSCSQIVMGNSHRNDPSDDISNYYTNTLASGASGDRGNYSTFSRRYVHSTSVEPNR